MNDTYTPKKPCPFGSLSPRKKSDRKCRCPECLKKRAAKKAKARAENPERQREIQARHRANNLEKVRAKEREYHIKNRDKRLAYMAAYHSKSREKLNAGRAARYRESYQSDREMFFLSSRKRRAAKLMAVPAWYSELDSFVMHEASLLSKEREERTGVRWEIDHCLPLQSSYVCGLHCAQNIQVIPSSLNKRKGNKIMMTNPFEWMAYA